MADDRKITIQIDESIKNSISPTQTLDELNQLPNGSYYAKEAGSYAFGVTVEDNQMIIFNKKGSDWTILSKVEFPSTEIEVKQTYDATSTDAISGVAVTQAIKPSEEKLDLITKKNGKEAIKYNSFTLEAGQVDATGGASTSVNWIKAVIDVSLINEKKIFITGFGSSNTSIINGITPRITFYKTKVFTANNKLSSLNDDGNSVQSYKIPLGAVLMVINVDGGTGVGSDILNSKYNNSFKCYQKIEGGEYVLNLNSIDSSDVLNTDQLKNIEQEISDLKKMNTFSFFDGIGYPQHEIGGNNDKYFDKISKSIFIKNNNKWERYSEFKSYPFTPPAGFDYDLNYKVFQIENGKYYLDWQGLFLEKIKSDYDRLTKYYVDPVNGLDTNDGLTPSSAFKSIIFARDNKKARNIILAKGIYYFNEGFKAFTDDNTTEEPFILRCLGGKAKFINAQKSTLYKWVKNGECYQTTRTNIVSVLDINNVDSNGLYINLKKVYSTQECQNLKNSWYTDGSVLCINTIDGVEPNENILLNFDTQNSYTAGKNVPYVYFENIESYADNIYSALLFKNNVTSQYNTAVYLKNCGGIGNTRGNGIAVDNIKFTIVEGCYGANVLRDALNYHTSLLSKGYVSMNLVEIDCLAYNTGIGTEEDSSNSSTTHEGIKTIRFNSIFRNAKGSIVADVNKDALSLNLGIEAIEDFSETTNSTSFRINGEESKMWIYNAVGYSFNDKAKSITANSGAKAYYNNKSYLPNEFTGDVILI